MRINLLHNIGVIHLQLPLRAAILKYSLIKMHLRHLYTKYIHNKVNEQYTKLLT